MKRKLPLFLSVFLITFSIFAQDNSVLEIQIKGAKKTKVSFIKNLIETQAGKPLDSLMLHEDMVRLKRLPAISYAGFQVVYSRESFYKVLITIEENFTIIPNINFWTTTNRQFAYKVGLYDYNFLGRNMTLGGFYQNNGFNTYGINFIAPNLFSKKWGISLNYQNWKSEEPLYFDTRSANYLYNNISYEVLALYQINFKNQLHFGLNFFNEKYKYLSGDVDPSVPTDLDLDKKLLKLVYTYDGLDYFYQYVNGFKSVLYAQYVTTQNDFQNDFFIAWNDFFYYKRLGKKGNWANRLRVGLSSNENTPFAPFALDNNVNLRGVGILVDRGTGSIVWNTEYRHTLYEKKWWAIQSNFFADIGSWRIPGGTLGDFFKSENIRVYSGVGLRFISKKIYNATFRIDYGFKIHDGKSNNKGGLVFGIGQYF